MVKSDIFPTIYNNSNYRVKNIPSYHPESMKFLSYWRTHRRRIFEGCWIPDTKEIDIDLTEELNYEALTKKIKSNWRWIPPALYYYINFGTILHKPADAPRTAPKQKITPYLSDFELAFAYNWAEARGFSGFEDDLEYSCNNDIIEFQAGTILTPHRTCYDSDNNLKKYVSPRKYLRLLQSKPLGRHLYFNEAENLMLLSARGGGKDLEENTIIHSVERGRIPIKDVIVGEYIYGADGLPTKVVDRRDFNNQMQYRITIADGRSLIAGSGHLWKVITNYGEEKIVNTADIRDNYKAYMRKIPNGKYNFDSKYFIPINEAIISEEKELLIDPYYLGLWLGDGSKNSTGITTIDTEIKNYIYSYCKKFTEHKVTINENSNKTCPTYSIVSGKGRGHNNSNLLLNKFKNYNLINNKYIPEIYFQSSYNQRLELLKGLMDSDGYICKKGTHIEFSSSIEPLALDVIRLSRSLGIRTEYSTRIPHYKNKKGEKISGKLNYRIKLKPRINVFKLERKAALINPILGSYSNSTHNKIAIRNVEEIGVLPSVCIAVDNKDRLFLAGEYIVTHNSWFSAHLLNHEILTDGSKYYTEEALKNPPMNEIFLGAGIAAKSADLAAKVKIAMDNSPGTWKKGTTEQRPSPIYKHMSGTLSPNNIKNPWRHEYPKKIGGEWTTQGSGSNLKHGVFTSENPEATAGGRYSVIVIEETGLIPNLLTVHGSSEATQMSDGTDKYGSSLYIGCVCAGTKVWTNDGRLVNIEELQKEDGIIGYHSAGYLPQEIEKFTEPVLKSCYRINLEGGDFLECSEDHPILISQRTWNKNIDWETYRRCTFRETRNIVAGNQLGVITSVPVFGNVVQEHARLLGLLVGDGYIGKVTPELSVDSEEVNDYITTNYSTSLKKQFVTKKGHIYRAYNIKKIVPLMRETGLFDKTKNNKTVPTDIDLYDKKSLSEFIGGYFDADGSVKEGGNGNVQITLTSNVKSLLTDIKFRLSKFGVESSIYLELRKTGYKGGSVNKYVLYVNRLESVLKFAENIKFLTKRKQDKLEKIYNQYVNKNSRTVNKLLYVGGDSGNFFEDSSIVEDINFVTVKSIEYIGQKPVYNLTAGGTHSYLANNIITHNTGGNIEKIVEAEIIFRDPEGFNMMQFDDEWENTGKIGWFVPAYYMDRKYKDAEGNTMLEAAYNNYADRRIKKKKAKSSSALDLEMMNYPLIPSEMFLNKTRNSYPTADLKHRLAELMTSPKILNATYKGEFYITLEGEIKWKNTDAIPIREFPLRNENMEGCVEMFFMPQRDGENRIPFGRYISAMDPIDDDSNDSNALSLQSFLIYDLWTEKIVLEYSGRTTFAKEFYEQCRRALIYYNARMLYENQKKGVFTYFDQKNSLYLLEDTPPELRDMDLQKGSTVGNKGKGIYATPAINKWGREQLGPAWMSSQASNRPLGVTNASVQLSVGLIREAIMYSPLLNSDRISAFGIIMIFREIKIKFIPDKEEAKKDTYINDPFFSRTFKGPKDNSYSNSKFPMFN